MKTSQWVSLWFGALMLVVVGTGAVLMTFTDFLTENLQGGKRHFFIVMLYAYFIFRAIRIYQMLQQSKRHD